MITRLYAAAGLAVLLLVMVAPTWAGNVYWNYNNREPYYATPAESCTDAGIYYGASWGGGYGTIIGCNSPVGGGPEVCTQYNCDVRRTSDNQYIINVLINKNTCPVGQEFDSGSCHVACPIGTAWNPVTSQCEDFCSPTQGVAKELIGTTAEASLDTVCRDECQYETSGIQIILADGTFASTAKGTGQACEAGDAASTGESAYDGKVCTGPLCFQVAGGTAGDPDCGTVNGQFICMSNVKDGACVTLSGGNSICAAGMSAPLDPATQLPKTKSADFNQHTTAAESGGTHTSTTYNYYGGSASGIDGTGEQTLQTLDELRRGACGGPEQPACVQQIDETGTPVGTDDMFSSKLTDALGTHQTGIGSNTVFDSPLAPPGVDDPGSCQQITLEFGNKSVVFPSSSGCIKLEQIRAMLAWMLYMLTAYALFSLALQKVPD